MNRKKIIVVGGGFAGINFCLEMARQEDYEVTLLDKNNFNFFPPLLYQVATGFLEASNISYPFRKLFHHKANLRFVMGTMVGILPHEKKIETDVGFMEYDFLVLANGTVTNYFGMDRLKEQAVPMKTVQDALAMRNHILCQVEQATKTSDPVRRNSLLTIVVAGAGPTGVEVSGMLAEMNKNIFKKDYPELQGEGLKIYLVDALPTVLAPMQEKSREQTHQYLKDLGVEILLNHMVKDYTNHTVEFANQKKIRTDTLIWTSGVTVAPIAGIGKQEVGRGGRLLVTGTNRLLHHPDIFALGDICSMQADEAYPNGHPQLAQVAIQQAQLLAKNFKKYNNPASFQTFRYRDKGSMAIVGVNKAVADLPKFHFKGFIAYLMWLFVHLFSLIQYRNQMKTFYNWMIAFFTRDQSLRFILKPRSD
ncbi:NADH dehydrogenase [Dyadobacter jejuensis]|uniref:NADH:ubiquinone reductase (non-electrogenic) n=1 Tax=Dyadobacter jejuensis TaxID=1082580 RepID=A0A316AGD2_9BACT|nr:NAD(P)/FAD-dependent oxidoreductase [Dyadobacter jejuensis]PWJ56846.1 NADH dehydrogenase [Dyadobacter jejuensis]